MDRCQEQHDYDDGDEQHGYGDGEEEDEDAQQLELEQEQAAGEVQCEADIEAAEAWSEPRCKPLSHLLLASIEANTYFHHRHDVVDC